MTRSDADMELNSRRMYDRRWLTKKFSAESAHVKHFLSTSLPDKFSETAPRPPLLDYHATNGDSGLHGGSLDNESRSASSDSMLQYDMSNRAQLPCGIENIRPHLATMDNVPLLVSLFTDCSPGKPPLSFLFWNDSGLRYLSSGGRYRWEGGGNLEIGDHARHCGGYISNQAHSKKACNDTSKNPYRCRY